MKIVYYENYKEDLRIFVERKEKCEGYFIEIGKKGFENVFPLSEEHIKRIPFDDKKVKEFLEDFESSNPLIAKKISGRESELISALREANKTIRSEEERKKSKFN